MHGLVLEEKHGSSMRRKRITVYVDEGIYEVLKRKAGIASLSAYIKSLLEREYGETGHNRAERVQRGKGVSAVGGGIAAEKRDLEPAAPVKVKTGKGECGIATAPGMYCPGCGKRH